MLKNKSGRIVNITSVVGHTGNLGQANYTASKAGIIAMSKSLAIEYAKKNININCISPGFIKTAMTDKRYRRLWCWHLIGGHGGCKGPRIGDLLLTHAPVTPLNAFGRGSLTAREQQAASDQQGDCAKDMVRFH